MRYYEHSKGWILFFRILNIVHKKQPLPRENNVIFY